jgi:heterodisulfide reductase subunit A-like polyferredoxin/coenzyme F420-reducing hydrogenase delta subunit
MTETKTTEMNEITIATDVLIIGGGLTGVKAASDIAELGYNVLLIEKDSEIGNPKQLPGSILGLNKGEDKGLQDLVDRVMADDRIEVYTQMSLISVTGVPGDFNIRLSKGDDVIEYKVGAIVVATDFSLETLNEKYGLGLSENVVTQSRMEAILALEDERKKILETCPRNIAFLVGFGQDVTPLVNERVMRSILAISEIDGCNVYVYVSDMKVASDSLERMYKEGREKGVIYFKLKEIPRITQNGERLNIAFFDPVIRRNIELASDLLVVEEAICADPINRELAELLRIDLGPGGFLQNENVHLFPVRSNREGIFVVGSSRQVQNLPWAWTDVENVAIEVKDLLGNGKKMVPKDRAVVDRGKCAICLTCYRCCPHGAIYWDSRAIISSVACQGCGICASECPNNAIQIGGFNDIQIIKEIKECVEQPGNGEPCMIAFCCENSAFEAAQMAKAFKMHLPTGLHIIKVPCAGKVDIHYIMTAFVEGADGVLVMACYQGNCKSERGNIYAGLRVDNVHRMLEETGFEKDRLRFANIASNMGPEFSTIVLDLEERIKELGLSPLKT